MKSPHKKSKKFVLMEEFIQDMLWEDSANANESSDKTERFESPQDLQNQETKNAEKSTQRPQQNSVAREVLDSGVHSQSEQTEHPQEDYDPELAEQARNDSTSKDQTSKDQTSKDQTSKDQTSKDQTSKDQAQSPLSDQSPHAVGASPLSKQAHIKSIGSTDIHYQHTQEIDSFQDFNLTEHPTTQPDYQDQQIDFDERLTQVQALLANMPKVQIEPPELEETAKKEVLEQKVALEPESKAEPAAYPEVKVDTPLNKQKVVPEQGSVDLPDEKAALEQDVSLDADTANQLLSQDVSREVTRLKEMLGDRFQTLIFDVGKLPLAVPLAKLGGIHTYSEEDITPIFGTPDWFEGLIPAEQGNIMLVDTAKLIMPEKYDQIKDQLDYKYAILLDDTRWALACTSVREAKTLDIDDIRWSEKGTKKEWFAGMVVQFMCALLEVDALINLLYRKGKEQKNNR